MDKFKSNRNKEYSEPQVLPTPLLLSVVHLVPYSLPSPSRLHWIYFEASAEICDKNFCLHRDILKVLTVTHVGTKAKGEEHF